jgi:hydroxymethylpyrimidine pyrophosphatase-like HAD family hydrolase
VDAVVGENGAFTFFMKDGIRKRIDTLGAQTNPQSQLKKLRAAILKRFPNAKVASDQAYREYDLAIDICEDVPVWPSRDVQELLRLCKKMGAHAKLSSIHVNAWFGNYDKRTGFEFWLKKGSPGASKKLAPEQWIFIGDSPNDEPLFGSFQYSVGVANLKKYLPELQHPPLWLTQGTSGKGFSEMAAKFIRLR